MLSLQSGAKINITDGACPERIVTVLGTSAAILKAFTLICAKFEEDLTSLVTAPGVPRPPITLRLIVPASQCGSLIGKGEDGDWWGLWGLTLVMLQEEARSRRSVR